MRSRNKGFSYIELIIVLAIMAIMIGLVSITIGTVTRANVNRGAEKLVSTLNLSRSTSMSHGSADGLLEITFDGNRYYYQIGGTGERVDFLASPSTVTYTLEGDATTQIGIPVGATLRIAYRPSTGSQMPWAYGTSMVETITLSNGDKTAVIKLYPETGKSELLY